MTHTVPQAGLTFIAWVNPNTLHAGIVTAIAKSYGYSNWDYDANFVESQIVEYKNNTGFSKSASY